MYRNNERIKGKWSGKTYTLQKKLGAGSTGEIYRARDADGKSIAIKISRDLVGITKEYANLQKFGTICNAPKVYELDDYEIGDEIYHFIVMECIEGYTLRSAVSKGRLIFTNKLDIAMILTDMMKGINDMGYVYTDLKYENVMIDKKNLLVRLIDLGSITPMGERVKEYTPMYDRSSWNAGSRAADSAYQVFAITILLISMLLNRDVNPGKEELPKVMRRLQGPGFPKALYDTLKDGIAGIIPDCGSLYGRLDKICRSSFKGKKLTYVLDAVIVFLSILLAALIRTVFT